LGTVTRVEQYREKLKGLAAWEPFLLAECGLPGPRGNLELARAAADEGRPEQFRAWLAWDAAKAPANSPREFLFFCGILGHGALLARAARGLAEGRKAARMLAVIRAAAGDRRWRAREAVAMALQRVGDRDMSRLLDEMERWADGSPWEQRAAAAALCEPRLLRDAAAAKRTLRLLDRVTRSLATRGDGRDEAVRTLVKGLGYCWSVAVAAAPDQGLRMMERWVEHAAKRPAGLVRKVMKENLAKARLARVDPDRVRAWRARLG
jgi:hypothetical protein